MAGSKKFNVGIIGYGLSAKVFHIPFLGMTDQLVLHSIVQRAPAEGNSAPHDYPAIKHFTSADQLIQDPEVDVVIVSTPPNSHFQLTKQALEAGKHVLVEKPFVPTAAEAEQLDALAREKGRILCVYQNRRWDADFLTVQKLIRDDTLGRIVEFETHFDRFRLAKPTTWKGTLGMDQGGGVIYDLGTHLLDQAYVLFGMPSTVSAKFVSQRDGKFLTGDVDGEGPDSFTVILSYNETGTVVFARVSVASAESRQPRFWIRGTKASYHKTHLDPQEDQLRAGMKATDAAFGHEDSSRDGVLSVVKADGHVVDEPCPSISPPDTYVKFYRLFAGAVESGNQDEIPVTAAQAAQVLKIIEAARESARTGREVAPK
ncbi:NAD(P)-binding protein [Thozetella sp. PMI_491]|nr:NAD(P)-binding protein [Thozetella sp. PMI_491]